MKKEIQCKHIPTKPILKWLHDRKVAGKGWALMFEGYDNSIFNCMPEGIPYKLALAKMRNLIEKGYVDGCSCGCRGDFEILPKGTEYLKTLND